MQMRCNARSASAVAAKIQLRGLNIVVVVVVDVAVDVAVVVVAVVVAVVVIALVVDCQWL